MPVYRINGRNVLFVHVPKTGGSTIERWLGTLAPAGCYQKQGGDPCLCPPQHLHADALKVLFPSNFFDIVFTIVRNPADRIRSEYAWRMRNRTIKPGLGRRSIPFSEASPERISAHFDKWLGAAFDAQKRDPYHLSNHIRPQTEFSDLAGCRVFRLEDGIDGAVDQIAKELDVPVPDMLAHEKRTGSGQLTLTTAQINRIRAFYRKDYAAFGYD